MKSIEITCDNCQKDLTLTQESLAWRLALANEQIAYDPECKKLSGKQHLPMLKAPCHFCSFKCFVDWVEQQKVMPENYPNESKVANEAA